MAHASVLLVSLLLATFDDGPAEVPLWPGGAPGSEARKGEPTEAKDYWVKNIHDPSLTVYLPPKAKATGAALVICPGGGHRELVFNAEGVDPARRLNELGVACFVLKYRLGREPKSTYMPLEQFAAEDGRRAVRLVRSRAAEWGVDPARVGLMGFSAGGEVASMVTFGATAAKADAADPVDRLSCRPDFLVEIYPGPGGIPAAVPKDAPPAFLLVADDDRGAARVIVGLLGKYREAGVPVEAHILAQGGHGFNMGQRSKLKSVNTWPQRLYDWLADGKYLEPAAPPARP